MAMLPKNSLTGELEGDNQWIVCGFILEEREKY
jgi:hypothetical protein